MKDKEVVKAKDFAFEEIIRTLEEIVPDEDSKCGLLVLKHARRVNRYSTEIMELYANPNPSNPDTVRSAAEVLETAENLLYDFLNKNR